VKFKSDQKYSQCLEDLPDTPFDQFADKVSDFSFDHYTTLIDQSKINTKLQAQAQALETLIKEQNNPEEVTPVRLHRPFTCYHAKIPKRN
jgi:hypothetical protein